MDFCLVTKVRKYSPEISGKKRSHGRAVSGRKNCLVSQPASSLLSHQVGAFTTHHSAWSWNLDTSHTDRWRSLQ